tara:strand:+ start:2224 stop:3006 length:783 start_codon:yes stop_codon:yes gene_type:complete
MSEIFKCLYCGSEEYDIIYKFNDIPKRKRIGKSKDIVKCKNCSLQYCHPRNLEESMLDTYENDYWYEFQTQVGERSIVDRTEDFEFISKERIQYIHNFQKPKPLDKFLDIGCAQGFLVNEAQKKGYNAHGIDLNNKDIEIGKSRYNVNIKKSLIQDYQESNFDIITTFNVIEHVSNPIDLLLQIKKRLNNDGLLVIGTHDIDCKTHAQQKEEWVHIIPNEHMYYFNIKTLENICLKAGFELKFYNKPIDNGITAYFKKIN